jgi:hypothetical protein
MRSTRKEFENQWEAAPSKPRQIYSKKWQHYVFLPILFYQFLKMYRTKYVWTIHHASMPEEFVRHIQSFVELLSSSASLPKILRYNNDNTPSAAKRRPIKTRLPPPVPNPNYKERKINNLKRQSPSNAMPYKHIFHS